METGNIIFILGMGRSGTSALARLLSLCGGRLPDELLPPNDANPTGVVSHGVASRAGACGVAGRGC